MERELEQMRESLRQANLMIDLLCNIINFRSGESGTFITHTRTITELLLTELARRTDRYGLTRADIERIGMASAIHDVGKTAVASEILNKPGKLKPEEYSVMKDHAMIGANMVRELPFPMEEPLIKTAYEICRWHHERYDGSGYPDGLKGEEIPISAQAVALADVYDALTGERIYKKAYPHAEAVRMLVNGEAGAFNPLLLESLDAIAPQLAGALRVDAME